MDEKCKECGQALTSVRCKCSTNPYNQPDTAHAAREAAKLMQSARPFTPEPSHDQ